MCPSGHILFLARIFRAILRKLRDSGSVMYVNTLRSPSPLFPVSCIKISFASLARIFCKIARVERSVAFSGGRRGTAERWMRSLRMDQASLPPPLSSLARIFCVTALA